MPLLKATVSAKPNSGIWQLAQLMLESLDKIFSLNSFLPKAAFVFMVSTGKNEKWMAADARKKKKMIKNFFIG